jgi:Helicase associated domain
MFLMTINGRTERKRKALRSWYDRLRELYKYKQDHGDCLVPQIYPPNEKMASWVNNTRNKPQSLTPTQKEALKAVGFVWAKPKGKTVWNEHFAELLAYKDARGDCNVPTKYPVSVTTPAAAIAHHSHVGPRVCIKNPLGQ